MVPQFLYIWEHKKLELDLDTTDIETEKLCTRKASCLLRRSKPFWIAPVNPIFITRRRKWLEK